MSDPPQRGEKMFHPPPPHHSYQKYYDIQKCTKDDTIYLSIYSSSSSLSDYIVETRRSSNGVCLICLC